MAATIFPFAFMRRGFSEIPEFRNAVDEMGAGRQVVQKLHAADQLVVRGTLAFPNAGGTYQQFLAFWRGQFGTFAAFLYEAQDKAANTVLESDVAIAAQVDFPALRRFIDAATLVVKVDGIVKVLGVDYSIQNEAGGAYVLGTSALLVVHFAAAPGVGKVISRQFDFYYPMRFEGDDMPAEQDLIGGGVGSANVVDRTVAVRMRETGPGYSFAVVPNAL